MTHSSIHKAFGWVGALGLLTLSAAAQTNVATEPLPQVTVMKLDECIQKALQIYPSIESAAFDTQIIESKLEQAKSAYFLPEIKLRVLGGVVPDVPNGSGPENNFPQVDTSLTSLGGFIQARVEAIQPIYTFGKISNLKRAAELGVQAKQEQERVAKNEVIRQVKKVYNGILALRSVLDFLNELRDRAQGARDRVQELLRKHSSDVTEIDLMRLDVFFAETSRETIEAKNGIELAMTTLGILTGGVSSSPVSPADPGLQYRDRDLKSIEYYLSRAHASRPELRQLDDAVGIKESLMKSVKSEFFPTFFLGGFYTYGKAPGREHVDNPFLNDDFNFNTGGGSLGFEQKLSFHMTDGRYHEARAEYQKALFDRKLANLGIELEVRKSHSQAVTKKAAVQSARDGFKAGRSWVTATTLNFGVGLVPVKDLLEAFVAYSKVKVGFFNTIREYDDAIADLSKAIGEEV